MTRRTPTTVTTAVLTLITLFFWAGFEVYRTLTTKSAPTVAAEIVNPLDPTLDTTVLGQLQQRMFLNDNEIITTTVTSTTPAPTEKPLITPAPSASPIASSSATPATPQSQ